MTGPACFIRAGRERFFVPRTCHPPLVKFRRSAHQSVKKSRPEGRLLGMVVWDNDQLNPKNVRFSLTH